MYKGYKIIDMDTHVGPRADTLEKYIEPSFRARLPELEPYKRTRVAQRDGGKEERITILTVAPLTFNRFPGTAPTLPFFSRSPLDPRERVYARLEER